MSEEDLESLITLDDPGEEDLGEDTFHQGQAGNTRQPFKAKKRPDPQTEVILEKDLS